MANVDLPARTAVNLYAATGFTVGVQLKVTNLTTRDVRLSTTSPGLVNDHVPIGPYTQAKNDVGDPGAFALCVGGGGVNVEEV